MDWSGGSKYAFANPNPYTEMFSRVGWGMCAGGTLAILVLWLAGVLTLSDVLWLEPLALVMSFGMTLRWGALNYRFARGVTMAPDGLTIDQWMSRQEYPWEDIEPISLKTMNQRGVFRKLWASAFYGSSSRMPCITVVLRRSIRLGLFGLSFGDRLGTRVWGIPFPGMKKARFYLREPEEFVEQARQLMKMLPPPAMSV